MATIATELYQGDLIRVSTKSFSYMFRIWNDDLATSRIKICREFYDEPFFDHYQKIKVLSQLVDEQQKFSRSATSGMKEGAKFIATMTILNDKVGDLREEMAQIDGRVWGLPERKHLA
ncbi:MAG: hypothetical protein Q9166_005879 [cf. Caloplaca sp. 2 TL-2023]